MATTQEQAEQVLNTYATRNGWPADQTAAWLEELDDAHSFLVGWNNDQLATLARKVSASKLPKAGNAAYYLTSLTGANVQGVVDQTVEAAAETITKTAKGAAKGLPFMFPVAAAAAVVALLTLGKK
jgi:hypothetical protein